MGQHTWFMKDQKLFDRELELWMELDDFCDKSGIIDEEGYYGKMKEIDAINELNKSTYHDAFRTAKRTEEGNYIEDMIRSKEECFKWIENPENYAYFSDYDVLENKCDKERAIKRLEEFWTEYPNGLIYFG